MMETKEQEIAAAEKAAAEARNKLADGAAAKEPPKDGADATKGGSALPPTPPPADAVKEKPAAAKPAADKAPIAPPAAPAAAALPPPVPPAPAVPLAVLEPPKDGADAKPDEPRVLIVAPRGFNLRLQDHSVIAIKPGVNEIPESVKDHPYLAAQGCTEYSGAAKAPTKGNPDETKLLREQLERQIGETRAAKAEAAEAKAKLAAAEARVRVLEAGRGPLPPPKK